jgi:hypothetical protein
VKKANYKAALTAMRRGETPLGGWGRLFNIRPSGSKLSRKAREGRLS